MFSVLSIFILDKTFKVVDSRFYDTYVEDGPLVRFLKLGIQDNHIILVASWDEMNSRLSNDGRSWLKKYGAGDMLDKVKFRDSYLLVGQRGLQPGKGFEKVCCGIYELVQNSDIYIKYLY